MSNLIDTKQKLVDYENYIALLEEKKAVLEGMSKQDVLEDVERRIMIYKTTVEIREKTKYKESLHNLMVEQEKKMTEIYAEVNENFSKLIKEAKALQKSMTESIQKMFFGIRSTYKENKWNSREHKINAYNTLYNIVRSIEQQNELQQEQSNNSNENVEQAQGV